MIESVQLREQPGTPLAVVRRRVARTELSKVVPECCGLVWTALKAQGIRGGRNVAVYLDGAIHVEVGVELDVAFVEKDDLVRSATPAGTVAWVTHYGPYGGLGAAHQAVHAWCRANGHTPAGPNWEIYGHWQDAWNADPSQIRTDVYYQLRSQA